MAANLTVAYAVLGVYLLFVCGCGLLGAWLTWRRPRDKSAGMVRENLMAGAGLGQIPWFFSMAASLFSGYSVSGIVNEAYGAGWTVTRWIPAGVGVYIGFMVLAPRCQALGRSRGYMTMSELIFERYLPPSANAAWVAHVLRLATFACLQLPVFTYLITQFRSVGEEVTAFTEGGITSTTAILVAAAVLLLCDVMGGMRAVAYSDVLQGVVLFFGSITFLIISHTNLGGLPAAWEYWSDPANLSKPRVANMQLLPNKANIVAYFDFVFKTTVAATMFPHLSQRLFCSKSSAIIQRGMSAMTLTFFLVQLSSMIIGWVAISALIGNSRPGVSAFGSSLLIVAQQGGGEAFASALLLASALCAMMSTADSALLAFSTMWVRDVFKPYVMKNASEPVQLLFGKCMAVVGLVIGVALSLLVIHNGKPDLTGLFALQNVTPIHVVPAVWLGLHWRSLRGEAVLAGLVTGLGVTLGLVFSDKNTKRAIGSDGLINGLSSSWVGFCVNLFVTVAVGLVLQYLESRSSSFQTPSSPPAQLTSDLSNSEREGGNSGFNTAIEKGKGDKGVDTPKADGNSSPRSNSSHKASLPHELHHQRFLDIGGVRDTLIHPKVMVPLFLVLLFTTPFYFTPKEPNGWVGDISAWAFISLFLSGILAIYASYCYLFHWTDYTPTLVPELPSLELAHEKYLPSMYGKEKEPGSIGLQAAQGSYPALAK